MNPKQKTVLRIGIIAAAVAVAAILLWYFLYKAPYDQAVSGYGEAAEGYRQAVTLLDERNAELDESIAALQAVIGAEALPLDETLLAGGVSALKEAREQPKDEAPELPEMPRETEAINACASEIIVMTGEVEKLGHYDGLVKNLKEIRIRFETLIQNFREIETEILWTGTKLSDGTDDPFLRFLVDIYNPNAEALSGLKLEWVAFDKNDFIVCTYDQDNFPVIPAEGHLYYVGGAGSYYFTGMPVRAEVTVKSSGLLTAKKSPHISVSNVQLVKEYGYYSVTAECETEEEIETAKLNGKIIIRDEEGQVVAAEFWSAKELTLDGIQNKLPETLPAGGKFILKEYISIKLPPGSMSAEIYVDCGEGDGEGA